MSYDFSPGYHLGMTPQGYYRNGASRELTVEKETAPRPLQHLTDGDLRLRCARGDAAAITEFEGRWRGTFK